jgi:hypothetical protein
VHSSSPNNRGYHDIRHTSLISRNEDLNNVQGANNEGYFGPELPSVLPYGRRLENHQVTPPVGSRGQWEPHPQSQPRRQPHDPSSAPSNDFQYYTTKRQFPPVHNGGTGAFRESSLEVSTSSSLLQVSIVPSVSFTLQDATHLGSSAAVLEDPLGQARNVPHGFGDAEDRTLERGPSRRVSQEVDP